MQNNMRKLIINADDLGMSATVNAKIVECIKLGIITSSTLMANAPAFEEGVRIAKTNPQISVGIHLNIIEFTPLTNESVFKKHGIVSENGCFIEGAIFNVPINEELKQAVFEEWDAQITKMEKEGLLPTHCDSHEHTHTIQELQDILCRVLDKHNIKRVRRTINPSIRLMLRARKSVASSISSTIDKNNAKPIKKRNVIIRRYRLLVSKYTSWRWNQKMGNRYILTDAFYSFGDFYSNRDVLNLGSNSTVIELMCHPGNQPFNVETEQLINRTGWYDDSYKLITYNRI